MMQVDTLDDYVNIQHENIRNDINAFIVFMKDKYPQIVPRISYSMPMWWAGKKMYDGYVAISAANKHYSVHFYDESCISRLKGMLVDCSYGKRCIHIRYGDEASIAVVKQQVKRYFDNIL